MTCEGAYANADDLGEYFCIAVPEADVGMVNATLRRAAGSIHAARAAQKGCDCTLAAWATDYLKQLNIWLAIAVYNCKCSNLKMTVEEKQMYLDAATADLELIRTGKLELCDGETAQEYPYLSWAERALTPDNVSDIIRNRLLRETN